MKKILIMLAAAAMIIPAASSCKKTPTPSGAPSSIKAPANEALQTKITFGTSSDRVKLDDGSELVSLEFTKGKKYIAGIIDASTKKDMTKTGLYNFTAAKAGFGTYTLEGLGTFVLEQDGSSIKVTATIGSETYTVVGTEAAKSNVSGTYALAFQDWKVNSVTLNVSGSGIPNISADYTGCDLEAIAKDIKDHGVAVDDKVLASLAGYNVTGISLTEFNTFEIDFSGKEPFSGTFSNFNPADGRFSYQFESFSENLVLAARATGSIYWKTASLGLSIEGDVTYNESKTYKAVVAFDLSPVLF